MLPHSLGAQARSRFSNTEGSGLEGKHIRKRLVCPLGFSADEEDNAEEQDGLDGV